MRETVWITGLYVRLSKEDNVINVPSVSIETQEIKLKDFSKASGLIVGDVYSDDGFSGTNFERPGFQRMLNDLASGKINCVTVKDMSRLGRNDIETNMYYEKFLREGIRLIAVDDGIDTLMGDQMNARFLNFMNAFLPRDISQKTRSAYKTKAEHGLFLGAKAPYGYKKDPEDKHHLIIDEETAPVVRHIFDLVLQGHGRRKIAKILREEKILTPAAYAKRQGITHYDNMTTYDNDYMWCDVTVGDMIENEVYIGNMVNHRKEKPFKSKTFVEIPKDEWIVVRGTHEPIVDKKIFEEAQKLIHTRRRGNKDTGTVQIFSGLIKCMDCGRSLVYSSSGKNYVCSTYNFRGKDMCPSHSIKYDDLYGVVLADIYCKSKVLEKDRDTLYQAALKCNEKKIQSETKENQIQLKKANKRIDDLEVLIQKTYENSVLGSLSQERMTSLLQGYETEQAELKEMVRQIEAELQAYHRCKDNANDFVKLIERYVGIRELTAPILNELIDRIEVGEKYEYWGETYQDVNIYYKFVGTVEINEEMCYTKNIC